MKEPANLLGADLGGANLSNATVTSEQLDTAHSLKDTIMTDRPKRSWQNCGKTGVAVKSTVFLWRLVCEVASGGG